MQIEVRIAGMTCRACAETLESAIQALPGVDRASVSYPTKRALVTGDGRVSVADVEHAINAAGYSVETAGHSPTTAPRTAAGQAPVSTPRRDEERSGDADYDLVVIGTGAAGMAAAIRASELGRTVAIVERSEVVGGTCVNIGCIPSKSLIEAAHHYHFARKGFPGVAPCEPQLAWDGVLAQKRELVQSLRQEKYTEVLAAYEGVTLLRGEAAFVAEQPADVVLVNVDGRDVRARRAVIATGGRPAMPPIAGLAQAGALDSTSVMELERLPASLLVIGGGAIGLELGQAFQRFGVHVIIVEALDHILPTEPAEVAAVLRPALEAEGMEFHTGTLVTRADRTASGVRLEVKQGSLVGHLEAEELLVATGRVPNVEGLGLLLAGVRTDARGYIEVDEYMRTANPRIFAGGDVTASPAYVYVAAYGGGIAAQAALADLVRAEPIAVEMTAVPRVTFTDPQVAAVGLSDAEARAAGYHVKATTMEVKHLSRAAVSYRQQGTVTMVAEEGTDRLLGAQVVAPNAGDIISEAVLAVRFGLTTRDIVSTMHPYLTWGEALKLTGQTFTRDVAKLSCCA